jgi:DHA1 family multidrug resistance protein-like MFS transporter
VTSPLLLPNLLPRDAWKRNQFAVTVSAAFIFSGFTLIVPFVPMYVQMLGVRSQAAAAIWAGIVLGISPLVASLAAPVWGRVAERYGLKIMAVRITFALFAIWALTAFAQNVYHLLVLRFFLGLLGGFNAFSISLATQLSPQEKVGRVIGTLQAVQISSTAVGPFVGGILAGWVGIRHTFLVTSFLCLLSLLLFVFLYQDKEASEASPSVAVPAPQPHEGLAPLMRLPDFAVIASLLFLVTTIDRSFSPVIPLFVANYRTDPLEAARLSGIILSLAAFAESFAAWYSGKEMTRSEPKQFLLVRLGVGSLICFLIGFAASVMQLLGLRVLLALLAGGTLTVAYTLASRVIPEGQRAAAFGLLSSFGMMGGAVGPLLGGFSVLINIRTIFFFDGLIYAGLSWALWRSLRGENKSEPQLGHNQSHGGNEPTPPVVSKNPQ